MMTKKKIICSNCKTVDKNANEVVSHCPFLWIKISASIECLLHKMLKFHINNLNINFEKLYKISSNYKTFVQEQHPNDTEAALL